MDEIVKIDLKDKKILRELDMNARMSIKELAKKAGLSRQVALYRIDRMKKEGLLLGAITVFDSAVVGRRWFRVLFQLQRISKKNKNNLISYFGDHPNTLWLGEVGGNWDIVVNFVTEDQFSFNMILEKTLEKWGDSISRYEVLTYIGVTDRERKYILPEYETERSEMVHEMKRNEGIKLDELDGRIISMLSKDAWLSATRISEMLKVNYKTVQQRIKRMEEEKLILGYRLMIHPRKIGYESNMLFLGIHSYKPNLEKQLQEFLKHQNVTFVVKQLGAWRVGIEIESRTGIEFQEFLVELRTRFGDIIATYETFPIFRDHLINYFPEEGLKNEVINY